MNSRDDLNRLRPVRRASRKARRRPSAPLRLLLETLEDRTVPSTIVWTNRGGVADTDNFTATYGANAPLARALVDRAIDDWERVIQNFNYAGGGNTYNINISAGAIAGRGVTSGIAVDAQGKPTSANITMDDNGGGPGWFLDATPNDDAEYTTLLNPNGRFAATGAGAGNDFYRTIVH